MGFGWHTCWFQKCVSCCRRMSAGVIASALNVNGAFAFFVPDSSFAGSADDAISTSPLKASAPASAMSSSASDGSRHENSGTVASLPPPKLGQLPISTIIQKAPRRI